MLSLALEDSWQKNTQNNKNKTYENHTNKEELL